MESTTKILFTTTEESTVTIVQSTWSDNTINFDGAELAIASAADGTGCRIYTLTEVAAGNHNITRGSGESGLFYIKVEVPYTVTFINDASWPQVYAYAWHVADDVTIQDTPGWPGTQLEDDGEGNYVWSTTGDPTKIIFNDGGSNQTADLNFRDGATYNSAGIIKKNFSATLTTDLEGDVYAYVWNSDDSEHALGDWPGTKLAKTDGVYNVAIEAEEAPAYIIFHNATIQTEDLAFVDGQAYEFVKKDFTVGFVTDAEWAEVHAYVWSGSGDDVVKFNGDWPGGELTEVAGLYEYTYNGYYAPEKIVFNNGSDDEKTRDLDFVADQLYLWMTVVPTYALTAGGENIPSGTSVQVKDASDELLATVTYGVEGGADFNAPIEGYVDGWANFTAYTTGNGENGTATSGTVYYIVPEYNGIIDVAVRLNGGKNFYILEDGEAMEGFNGITIPEAENRAFDFEVKAGSTYTIYCTGSKLGFFGFDYSYSKPVVKKVQILGATTEAWDDDSKITLDLTEGESNVYTGVLDLSATPNNFWFKLVTNESNWIGYNELTVDGSGLAIAGKAGDGSDFILNNAMSGYKTYDVTATWSPSDDATAGWTLKIAGKATRDDDPNTYAIVGDFFTVDPVIDGWAADQTMTQESGNIYRLTVEDLDLAAGTYEYKLRANGNWDGYQLPAEGNFSYAINEAGTYDLEFVANVGAVADGGIPAYTVQLTVKKAITLDKEFVTFSSKHGLDFTDLDVKAYRAELSGGKVLLKQVNGVVVNNTGLLLRGAKGATYKVEISGGEDAIGDKTNLFKVVNSGDVIAASTEGSYNYVLATTANGQGFYKVTADLPVTQNNKAFLHTEEALSAEAAEASAWIFDGETTGVNDVRSNVADVNGEVYNLAGQRVAQPTKGLYIMNGKKVVVK